MTPDEWLKKHFPRIATAPLGDRHKRLYGWFDSLTTGAEPPTPRIEIWPRGGAKSSTVELAIARLATNPDLPRRFVLYVCATQEQADTHVQAIASLLEELGVERKLNKFGHSRGWRRNQLRTENGFNVAAIGLDTAARGIKFDEFRPDLIVFDDIDSEEDTPKTVAKKIQRVTKKIIPAGTPNKAIVFVQNLIHEDGIVNQLYEGRAKFLHNRDIPPPEPAVIGLEVEQVKGGNGKTVYRITAGTATWEGQNLAACEQQINDQGYEEFLRESQHEIHATEGYFFNVKHWDPEQSTPDKLQIVGGLPDVRMSLCRGWDFAATQGGGDFTSGNLHAWLLDSGVECIVDVVRGQWSSDNVRLKLTETANADLERYGALKWRLPLDPGPSTSHFRDQIEELLRPFTMRGLKLVWVAPHTRKALRARGFADQVNSANALLVRADWNYEYVRELRKFREDEEHEFDDQVDASADAHNEIAVKKSGWADALAMMD